MADLSTIGFKADMTGINQINKGLDNIGNHSTKAEAKMNKASKSGGQAYTQLGYQINDFATQIASGQSAMVALTQQGSQLIQVFNPLASAAFAVAGAIAGALLPSLFDASNEIENTSENVEILIRRYSELDDEAKKLVKNQIRLNNATASIEIANTALELKQARESLREIEDNGAGFFDFGSEAEILRDARKRVEDLEVALEAAKQKRIEYNEEVDEALNEVSDIDKIINSYMLKTAALSRDRSEMAKNIAIQKLGADATDEEIFAVSTVIEGYYQKADAIKAEIEAEQKAEQARKKAEAEAISQAEAYDRWLESVEDSVDPTRRLTEQIEMVNQAMSDGDLSFSTATKRIAQLSEEIELLSDKPMGNFIDQTSEALEGIRMFEEQGTQSYENLSAAIYAAAAAQAFMSGNIISGAISGFAALDELFGGEIDASAYISAQESQGLNEWNEKASSINDAVELTASSTEKLVGINTDMLEALTTLQDSISSAAGMIAGDVTIPNAPTSVIDNVFSWITDYSAVNLFGSNIFTELFDFFSLNWLFDTIGSWLGGSSKVVDEGIFIVGDTLGNLMDEVLVGAYQDVDYKSWKFGSTKSSRAVTDITDEVGSQFALVFTSIADSVYEAATTIGIGSADVTSAIQGFVIDTINISLKDMTVDEQVEALESVFSEVFNDLAEEVVPWLSDLQQTGEELGETLVRVANEVAIADYLVDAFGTTFGDKLADPEAYAKAADNLATLTGGVEELSDSVSTFISSFASDEQQLEILFEALEESLSEVGLTLPDSASGYYDLAGAIDASTEAGQEQLATILNLTDTAASYYDILEDQEDALNSLSDSLIDVIFDMYDVSDAVTTMGVDAALAAARVGDFSLAELLDTSEISVDSSDFATATEFNIAQAQTANKLLELSELAAEQTSVDEEQLAVLIEINNNIMGISTPSDSAEEQADSISGSLEAFSKEMERVKYAAESMAKTGAQTASYLNKMYNGGLLTYQES